MYKKRGNKNHGQLYEVTLSFPCLSSPQTNFFMLVIVRCKVITFFWGYVWYMYTLLMYWKDNRFGINKFTVQLNVSYKNLKFLNLIFFLVQIKFQLKIVHLVYVTNSCLPIWFSACHIKGKQNKFHYNR